MFGIETVAHFAEMGVPILIGSGEQSAFLFEVSTHRIMCDVAALDAFVKVDDVGIGVTNDMCAVNRSVEPHHARSEKRLNPMAFAVDARFQNEVVNPRHKFGFDTLLFYGWNGDSHLIYGVFC